MNILYDVDNTIKVLAEIFKCNNGEKRSRLKKQGKIEETLYPCTNKHISQYKLLYLQKYIIHVACQKLKSKGTYPLTRVQ